MNILPRRSLEKDVNQKYQVIPILLSFGLNRLFSLELLEAQGLTSK